MSRDVGVSFSGGFCELEKYRYLRDFFYIVDAELGSIFSDHLSNKKTIILMQNYAGVILIFSLFYSKSHVCFVCVAWV